MSQGSLLTAMFLTVAGVFCLSTFLMSIPSFQRKGTFEASKLGGLFFYSALQQRLFPNSGSHLLILTLSAALHTLRILLGGLTTIFLWQSNLSPLAMLAIALLLLLIYLVVGDGLPALWSNSYPDTAMSFSAPIAATILTGTLPLTYVVAAMGRYFHQPGADLSTEEGEVVREQLMELLQGVDGDALAPQEKKMIESVVTFRDRIVREVMVPRVNLFSLPHNTSIKEAAAASESEGFSRVPVYRNSVDEISGILMYKDLLLKYMEYEQSADPAIIEAPIDTITKGVLYTPETKKISNLLQEFRAKQTHLAIVVDEYGGTEGLVTIEDILEEFVGEIADEYDEEEALYHPLPSGGWIVDARMTINDIESELGVKIPSLADYDTIGGYIYHRAGSIPQQGFAIDHDEFRIEVIRSSDRCIERLLLVPPNTEQTDKKDQD